MVEREDAKTNTLEIRRFKTYDSNDKGGKMIPQGRQLYLEAAKASNNRSYRIQCFRNFVRVLNKGG